MTTFNFLRSAPPDAVGRILEFSMPPPLRAPLAVMGITLLVVICAAAIEQTRLAGAIAMTSGYRIRYENSRLEVSRRRVVVRHVAQLRAQLQGVRAVRSSGERLAQIVADVGNRIPRRAWLRSVVADPSALAVEGSAESFGALLEVLKGWERPATSAVLLHAEKSQDAAERLVRFRARITVRT